MNDKLAAMLGIEKLSPDCLIKIRDPWYSAASKKHWQRGRVMLPSEFILDFSQSAASAFNQSAINCFALAFADSVRAGDYKGIYQFDQKYASAPIIKEIFQKKLKYLRKKWKLHGKAFPKPCVARASAARRRQRRGEVSISVLLHGCP
jgi:hypothetical protein